MKITKEYLRTIIKEELSNLSTAAQENVANDIRSRFGSDLDDKEAIDLNDKITSLNNARNDPRLSDGERQRIAQQLSITKDQLNRLKKDSRFTNTLSKVNPTT